MHDQRSRIVREILDKAEPGEEAPSFTSERQHTAQAGNLHVEWKDGRQTEGFAWSHYVRSRWTDEGDKERLVVLFGEAGAVEIEGRNLGALVGKIRDGQLNGIRELASRQLTLLENQNPDSGPMISSIRSYPDFDEIFREIKGEDDDKHRHTRRAAGR